MPTDFHTAKDGSIKWSDSGSDELISLVSLGATGQNGALHDWGAMPRPTLYHFTFVVLWDTAPLVGDTCRLYLREAGGIDDATATNPTNDDTVGDVALGANKERNLVQIATLVADEALADIVTVREGEFRSSSRWSAPTVINDVGGVDILSATPNDCFVIFTPIFDQAQ